MVKPVRSHAAFSARLLAGAGLSAALLLPAPARAEDLQASDPIAEQIRKSLPQQDGAPSEPINWDALNWDPWSLTTPSKQSSLSNRGNPADAPLNWDRKVNPDGSASYVAKKRLPTAFDTNIGLDTASGDPGYVPAARLMSSPPPATSGAAWANVTMSGATIDARVDPRQDQARLGTTLKKSVPMNDSFSVSIENGYSVTDTFAAGSTGAWGVPSTAAPRVYATDGTAKLTYEPTGTTFSTGTRLSSTDEKWRSSIGAEQKLFGGLNVSGSVSETDTGAFDRTLSAGFKKTW